MSRPIWCERCDFLLPSRESSFDVIIISLFNSFTFSGCKTDYNPDFYSCGQNIWVLGGEQLSYKQRNLSAPHQTKIVDWLGPPHSFTVWHGPSLEWCWWCCWGGGGGWGGVSLGTGPGWGEGRMQNTTSLCSSALKDSPSCDNRTESQNHRSQSGPKYPFNSTSTSEFCFLD